jgi:hypothetical protein
MGLLIWFGYQKMDLQSSHFTHVFTNFGVAAVPSPRSCLTEIFRVLSPGGINAFTHWASAGSYELIGKAIEELSTDNEKPPFPSWSEFYAIFSLDKAEKWYDIDYVVAETEKAGFVDIRKTLYKTQTKHKDAQECWDSFQGITKIIVQSFWNTEQKEKWYPNLEGAMIKVLEKEYGPGVVTIDWSAWVIISKKPGP